MTEKRKEIPAPDFRPTSITGRKLKELRRMFITWAMQELPYEDFLLDQEVKRIQGAR